MLRKDDFELIELYLEGKLNEEDRYAFEARLASDLVFAEEYEEHASFLKTLKAVKFRNDLKNKLNKIHEEEFERDNATVVFTPSSAYQLKSFFKRHFSTMAVAASVALITAFGSLLMVDYLKSFENKQMGFYQELKREVDYIKKSHKKIKAATDAYVQNQHHERFSGTGFAISSNGFLVTNYHLVRNADSLFIESRSDKFVRLKVSVIANDKENDLAILKVDDANFKGFARIPYSIKNAEADLGEHVFTLAFPREDMVYGEGSISSRSGYEGDTTSYQISIPVNPGNSGGPLLDEKGQLIGVITGKNTKAEGAAFAIKSRYLSDLLRQLPDSVASKIKFPQKAAFKSGKRAEQIHQIQDLVFNIKVYNN